MEQSKNLEKLIKRLTINFLVLSLITIFGFIFLGYSVYKLEHQKEKEFIEKTNKMDSMINEIDTIRLKIDQVIGEILPKKDFLRAIGHAESGNNYACANQHGYIGKYQFGLSALVETGVCENYDEAKIFRDEFLNAPDSIRIVKWSGFEQERAMLKLMSINKKDLRRYIKEFKGKIVNGIYITESGILAAAHLGGSGSVKKYFDNQDNFSDGNGTSIEAYLKRFCGYKIS